ncbi:MAG: hypothetical protein JO232_21180 [Verrucomicrobia bacterium]|nr:hypothetical protein [Verrucomicrobiota bacterium]
MSLSGCQIGGDFFSVSIRIRLFKERLIVYQYDVGLEWIYSHKIIDVIGRAPEKSPTSSTS